VTRLLFESDLGAEIIITFEPTKWMTITGGIELEADDS
jgi:hypothetical protein